MNYDPELAALLSQPWSNEQEAEAYYERSPY